MENNSVKTYPTHFPPQKKTDSQKTKEYYKQCIESGIQMVWWNENSFNNVRASRKNKITCYNLYNNKVDKEEMNRVLNPFNLQDVNFPVNYTNYPILNQNINILLGEERKRFFNPVVSVVNSDFVNEKLEYIKNEFSELTLKRLLANNISDEQSQQEMQEFDKWRLDYRDRRERMVQQICEYGYRSQQMKEMFSRGFEDLLVGGEEIYVCDIYGGEPIVRKGNPLNFFTLRSGESPYIENSDIIVEDGFLPVGEVIDRYHEYLTDNEIKQLENKSMNYQGNTIKTLKNYPDSLGILPNSLGIVQEEDMDVNQIILAGRDLTFAFGGYYDIEGNVRVTRVVWKGMRDVMFVTSHDEDGNEIVEMYPGNYNPLPGEVVKKEWITEWYEGTKIGYDIYIKQQPLEIQSRKFDNPSICHPGIVGTIFNINSNKSKSIISMGKDWQYRFNAFMHKLELLFIKSKGKIGKLPLHLIPDGWEIDKALYYAEFMGWMPTDAFKESNQPNSMGQPAGRMNESSPVIDLSFGQEIQQTFLMLDFIKRNLDELVGITPQRKGAVDNRETLGGVERAVTQSSLTTEKWFSLHDFTKIRVLKAYVETCKIAWKGKSFKRNFILDDGSIGLLDFDSDSIQEIDMGIDISVNTEDQQLMQTLRGNVERMLQNQTPLSVIIDLFRTKDPSVLQKKIKAIEEQQQQAAEQARQDEKEQFTVELEQRHAMEEAELQFKYDEMENENVQNELDREADIEKQTISALGFSKQTDANTNGVPDVLEERKVALEHIYKSHDIALAKRQQALEEKRQRDEVALKNKELKLKEKDINTKLKIAKSRPKSTAKKK